MTNEEAEKLALPAATSLGEHFDSVQVLVSWMDEGTTKCTKRGVGNWYARQGMAHEFINSDIACESAIQIAERLKPPTDEGDNWKTAPTEP